MMQNFFSIAFRNISRQKVFTFINITGLAIGFAAAFFILLWIADELSFETFNIKAKNIFRVEEDQFYSGEKYHVTVTPHPSGPVWKEKIPEIKGQTRINRLPRLLFRKDDKVFFENSIVAADSGLFEIFTLPLISGNPESALAAPHSIVLTEKLARKYFGDKDPLGESVTVENKYQFMVTGILKDLPRNTMFTFGAIIPYSFLREIGAISDSWGSNSILTFVLLENGASVESVNKKLTDVVLEFLPETKTKYMLFPLLDIHLHSQFGFGHNKGPITTIYIFSLIAFFIILIACINFINLSTAKASVRAREIGIKKVTGANRSILLVQFVLESLMTVIASMIFALVIMGLTLEAFNNISGKTFELSDIFRFRFLILFLSAGLIAGIAAAVYPAVYLTSFNPVAVLRGETLQGRRSGRLRQILVVVQISLSILIATASVFMYLQLKYLQQKDLGFEKENLICIPMADNMKVKYYSLKRELLSEPLIKGVTASMRNPVMIGSNSGGASWDGKDPEKTVLIGTNAIDYDYLQTMKMALVSGRDFSRDFVADLVRDTTGNFLINEEVARIMDVGDPVGKNFRFMGINGKIIGVMKNFHFKGADQPIEPMAFALGDTNYLRYMLVRLNPDNPTASMKTVEKVWNDIIPEYPLEFSFTSQDYNDLFSVQMRLTGLLRYFTFLAVIIACLGLYGLSSFSAERRTNEIGIRKVVGADALAIVITMSKEFVFLILISLTITLPIGWLVVRNLLKQFAFRIDINGLIFAGIAAGTLLIALITVSFQAYRATRINPAEALMTV
jgi:ABC-type antimicrobial peptide transport system permease subunit